MASQYEIIAAQLLRVNSRNHAAWNEWGRGIFDEALRMPPEIAEQMLTDAGRKFTVASVLSPSNAVYWQNRGAALLERAKRDTTGTPLPLLEEASQHYESAIRLSARQFEAWKGAALCYMERAMRTGAKECESLCDAAFVRFAVLAELSPGNHDTWLNWGVALLNCAQKLQNERSLPLLFESVEKSDRAFALHPDNIGPLNNAAIALLGLAERLPDTASAPLWLADADAKLRQGIALSPGTALLWANRGLILLTQSRHAARSAKQELMAEAAALFLVAHRLDPDSHQTLLNWGNLYSDLGTNATTDEEAVAHYAEADAKFRACVEIEPGVALYWTNWGILHTKWALDGDSGRSFEHRREAWEKFAVADSLSPHAHNNLFAWSEILCFQAMFAIDDRQFAQLMDQAEEQCQKAENIQSDWYRVFLVRGNIFLRKAYRETDPGNRESLLLHAWRSYQRADEIDPGKGVYDMACVAALRGMPDECQRLLEDGLERDLLPLRRRIMRDDDMLSVRDEEWFRQLLERLPR